jgi:hypothetical protein
VSKLENLRRTQATAADAVADAVAATVAPTRPTSQGRLSSHPVRPTSSVALPSKQPTVVSGPVERINIILPLEVLEAVDKRIATLGRRKKVSFSGYVEAALRELLATGANDVDVLDRYKISARRRIS